MKSIRCLLFICASLLALSAQALEPRMVFDKYLWAEGVNPKARYLDQLMVKFFDEDMIRLREGKLVSITGANSLLATKSFLTRHPEIQVEGIIHSMTEEAYAAMIAENERNCGVDLVDLFSFYRFQLPAAADDPKALLAEILKAPEVETAYYEPIPIDLTCTDIGDVTPDFTGDQQYHDPAPEGVDYDFAQSAHGADVVDGHDGWWAGIVENGFTIGHEDVTSPQLGFSGSWSANNDHGTACTGIVGACDDNNIGCIGFAADWTMTLFARGSDAYGSLADCVTDANNDLIEGEVVNHSWGYTADPMPAGNTCPCNEDQNGSVPCEYNAAVRAAIQNGGGENIYHLCAAANGCVDLDDPVFGGYFDWSNDTWSVFVGGVQWNLNGSVHDAICFTDWGQRVTSNAWANGVRSHGYASSWPADSTDGDPDEYYCWFSGTSAATPIICGVTAVISRMWYLKWGSTYLHPQTMRSLLTYLGTPPGATPGEIGVMPDLRAILGANLTPHWQADGWDSPIVPRQTAGATSDNVALSATLLPAPGLTYINWNVINESLFKEAEPAKFSVYLDDELLVTATNPSLNYATWDYRLNQNFQIGGGRHTLRNEGDHLNELVEGDETDNAWVESYCWNPTQLNNTNIVHNYPPRGFAAGQTSPYRNRDGFRNTSSGQWRVNAIMCSTTGHDYDFSIYDEVPNSTFGYQSSEADGANGGAVVDIVGRNRNTVAGEDLLGVMKNNNTSMEDYSIHCVGSSYIGTATPGRNLVASESFTGTEILYAIEFNVDALVPHTVELEYLSGGADIVGEIFEPNLGYFYGDLSSEYFYANTAGYGWIEHFTPTQLGRHCLVIHKYDANDYGETADFNVYLGKSLPDLKHVHYSDWPEPIVVTQSPIAAVPPAIPPFLTGNASTNLWHAQYTNIGGIANPPFVVNDQALIDAYPVHTTGEWWTWNPGDTTYWSNQGEFYVQGGRHTITDIIDINNEQPEWNEDNNRWDVQYVWSPFAMNLGATYNNPAAPNGKDNNSADFFVPKNCDGWSWRGSAPPQTGNWTGAAVSSTDPGDWYDIVLYQNHTSATEGFDDSIIGSQAPQGKVQFVITDDHNVIAPLHEVGVFNRFDWPEQASIGRYYIETDAATEVFEGCNGIYTLQWQIGGAAQDLFQIFEMLMMAGDEFAISVDNLTPTVDLNIGVYSSSQTVGSRSYSGENAENNGPGGDETVYYTANATGYHAIVVYRDAVEDIGVPASFLVQIGPRTPKPPTEVTLYVVDSSVDPIQMRARWEPATEDINNCSVIVNDYHLYFNYDMNATFDPNTWTLLGSTPNTFYDFDVPAIVENFQMVVVAEDTDALIIQPSGGDDGATLTAGKNEHISRTHSVNTRE